MSLRVSTSSSLMLRLLGAHVKRRADHLAEAGKERLLRQARVGRLGHAEVDHLRHGRIVVHRDHHVARLDVAVDDPLLMGVLDGLANRPKQLQPLPCRQVVLVAVLRDRNPAHQLHHEVRPARFGRSGVEHFGDVGMVHHRQRLPLRLEPGDHLLGVHSRLDDLQGHLAPDRLLLLGHEDDAEAAFADLLQELVAADDRAGLFA